jgi:hypothetical protein
VSLDKEKTDNKGGQEIEQASQDNEAIISRPLKNLINYDLKQPVVIIPGFGRCNVREECILGDGSILPEISSTGQMIPQVGIIPNDGPGNKIVDQDYKKYEN